MIQKTLCFIIPQAKVNQATHVMSGLVNTKPIAALTYLFTPREVVKESPVSVS
jgi:hypothetical protein